MKRETKLSTMTLISTVITTTILFLCIGLGVVIIRTANGLVSLKDEQTQATRYAEQLSDASDYLTDQIRAYSSTADPSFYDAYWYEINTTQRREEAIAKLTELGVTNEELNFINHMKAASDQLVPLEEAAMARVAEGDRAVAIDLVYGSQYESGKTVVGNNGAAFQEAIEARYAERVSSSLTRLLLLVVLNIGVLVVLLIYQYFNASYTRRKAARPLGVLSVCLQKMSEGDLHSPIPLEESTSEVGQLTGSMKRLQLMLQDYISDISGTLHSRPMGI